MATLALLTASLFLLWLVNGQATLATVVLLAICSGAVNTLVAGWLLHRRVTKLPPQTPEEGRKADPKKVLREVLSISWPLLIVSLVMMVRTNGDIWMLGAFLPQGELALYGAANRLVTMVTMPMAIVTAVAPPLIAEMYSQGRREDLERALRSMATLTGIPAWMASMGCIFFAGPILGLVYGNYYREGAVVLALLSIGLFASVCAGSCGIVLAYTGHQKTLMMITIASSAATLIAMIATVEPYGIVGVAIGDDSRPSTSERHRVACGQAEDRYVDPRRIQGNIPTVEDHKMTEQVTVLYIGGRGRSGSTILARTLGQIPGFVNVGELSQVWYRGLRENERCGCGQPFYSCEFWRAVGDEAFGGWDNVDVDKMVGFIPYLKRQRYAPHYALAAKTGVRTRKMNTLLEECGPVLERLYRAIQRVSGAGVIVDSSKRFSYAVLLSLLPFADLRVVHLVRDSRAVAYSWARSRESTWPPS